MQSEESKEKLMQFVRATFPYLVFIGVFIIGMVAVMFWASSEESKDAADIAPLLPRAHAHNDYEHARPLLDALSFGFCSIEADIYLVDGELLVAHDRDKVDPVRTLDALYLNPLWKRFEANKGSIYSEPVPVTLLVDIKNNGAETYTALHQLLLKYAPMLTHFSDSSTERGAVTVIISGERANNVILATEPRLAGIDGRVPDLEGPVNPHQMPLISDNWFKHFKWLGTGELPAEEAARLDAIVAKAKERGVQLRFWATPQSPEVWGRLYDAGVDLLNADDLAALRALLLEKQGASR